MFLEGPRGGGPGGPRRGKNEKKGGPSLLSAIAGVTYQTHMQSNIRTVALLKFVTILIS